MIDRSWRLEAVRVCAAGERDKTLLTIKEKLVFKEGTITLLIGSNGAGKSTLLETMAGLRRLNEGQIAIGADLLWVGRRRRLSRSVVLNTGIALQHSESQWFAATVKEELLYSLKPYKLEPPERERRLHHALQAAGLPAELLARDPWSLSGGQQRRLALACLLACEPQWLLLDEPTAGLDAEGISRLCAVLAAHKAAGRGAVVATHDPGALLPLADEVVVVARGSVREAVAASAWANAHAADAAAPQALRALAKLRGFAAQPPGGGAAVWPAPEALAAAIHAAAAQPQSGRAAAPAAAALPGAAALPHAAPKAPPAMELRPSPGAAEPAAADVSPPLPTTKRRPLPPAQHPAQRLATRFDPRALIAAYMLLAATIIMQHSWSGLLLAGALAAAIWLPLRTQMRTWLGFIRAYALIILLFGVVAGAHIQPLSFDWEQSARTMLRLATLFCAMLLGLPMLLLMTPLRIQRALEQTFGWMSRFKVPISSITLTVTLIFRFIPLLLKEWERFAKIAHARGKAITPVGALPPSMLASAIIPYIRSILRMAEQMAEALEARGFGNSDIRVTRGFQLRFGRQDILMLGAALIVSAVLYMWATI
ncbi:energy-coupling factor transport system ATP-binding protein [Paenibacillus algorifonticola]|uniref:Energy-coupling factor transport system ATP-binding protein n=3 Tax=Paenibacillus algorifonticola TaxID=684063 RepID=A0A1I1YFH9_9BACL|nr:ATP-binding cassette domain-containing protein [Paenibacillus algorifonticola]SFE18062.1 energy-coupling factor transport system ATP-binding protein [Paenibacillus algorifonticola]